MGATRDRVRRLGSSPLLVLLKTGGASKGFGPQSDAREQVVRPRAKEMRMPRAPRMVHPSPAGVALGAKWNNSQCLEGIAACRRP